MYSYFNANNEPVMPNIIIHWLKYSTILYILPKPWPSIVSIFYMNEAKPIFYKVLVFNNINKLFATNLVLDTIDQILLGWH